MKERLTFTIDSEILNKLINKADKDTRSLSFIVNEILNKYFEKKKFTPKAIAIREDKYDKHI